MPVTVGEAEDTTELALTVDHLRRNLESWKHVPDGSVLLVGGGGTKLFARALEMLLEEHRRLAELEAEVCSEVWTDEAGENYDLTVGYLDDNGDRWTPIGWLIPFGAVPEPYLESNGLACGISTVIREEGPITPDPNDKAGAGEPS